MNDKRHTGDPELQLLDQGLAFYGTITASVSHELNNVVSIIDQTTGLLEDMIADVKRGKPISTDRLDEIAGSLRRQTGRGLDIIKRLNAFSHSSDVPRCRYNISDAVTNLVDLSRRLADMKRIEIDLQVGSGVSEVSGNPFFARQAIFEPIRQALSHTLPGDRIGIRIGKGGADTDAEVWVKVAARSLNRDHFTTPFFHDLLSRAGATVTVAEKDDRATCHFLFTCKD